MPGLVPGGAGDHGDDGQEILQVERKMQLGGGLAPPVLGPVHATGDKLDGRGVDDMNRAFEPARHPLIRAAAESGRNRSEIIEHLIEQLTCHRRVARSVGVGKAIAAARRRATNVAKLPDVIPGAVAHIVQADGVRHLRQH